MVHHSTLNGIRNCLVSENAASRYKKPCVQSSFIPTLRLSARYLLQKYPVVFVTKPSRALLREVRSALVAASGSDGGTLQLKTDLVTCVGNVDANVDLSMLLTASAISFLLSAQSNCETAWKQSYRFQHLKLQDLTRVTLLIDEYQCEQMCASADMLA